LIGIGEAIIHVSPISIYSIAIILLSIIYASNLSAPTNAVTNDIIYLNPISDSNGKVQALTNTNLYDSFENDTYTLSDGQISPGGKWKAIYNGYGSSGVKNDSSGGYVFFMYPKTSTVRSETHASLVISTQIFSDFNLTLDVKTEKQLRQNSLPNAWETAWVFFRYSDTFHYYWFQVKPNGIELGKKDCDTCTDPIDGQISLKTASTPNLRIGEWSKWKINAKENQIEIWVDGIKIIDFIDHNISEKLSSGAIALYNEDAAVSFDNIYIISTLAP
jgi:hypothetical protein